MTTLFLEGKIGPFQRCRLRGVRQYYPQRKTVHVSDTQEFYTTGSRTITTAGNRENETLSIRARIEINNRKKLRHI